MVRTNETLVGVRAGWLITAPAASGFLFAAVGVLVDAYVFSIGLPAIVLATLCGALVGMLISNALVARRERRQLNEQIELFDGALNSMIQGFCVFDTDRRLLLWNQPYIEMYRIDPKRIWRGCTIEDVRAARRAAGTFSVDPKAFERQRKAGMAKGETFSITADLTDGRVIAAVYHAVPGGGWLTTHEDVTERVKAQRDLEHTRKFLDSVVENTPSPIIVKSIPDMRYMLVNRAAEKFLGVDRKELLGKKPRDVLPDASAEMIEARDQRLADGGQPIFIDEHAVLTQGGTRIATSTRLSVRGPEGTPHYLITLINDLTERKRDQQQLAHLTSHDLLTNLPNRLAFNDTMASTIDLAGAAGESFAVLCIDLDRFKEVNDVHGHAGGDTMLREVARRLESAVQGAFLARIGGDEFAIISPTGAQPKIADALASGLCAAFDADIDVNGHPLHVGVTVGIAIFPQDGEDAATLMANADAALYRAKGEARGSIRFFERAMDAKLRERRALQHDLSTAIADGEISLHYQPQGRIDGAITGFEALARWHHPRLGPVAPMTFIPLAEESGDIVALGEWILREAAREAASWPQPHRIGVNLSPVQIHQIDLPRLVHEILIETGLKPERLELEVTEGVLIGDFDRALSVLRRLKALGVRIAMDDFGTGYSSLSYLQSFPFDKIKIDRAFITNICHSEQAAAIVRSIVALGHGLSLPVLAEGVETEAQRVFLAAEGCDELQGYLLGKPKPIADYAELVGRRHVQHQPQKHRLAAG